MVHANPIFVLSGHALVNGAQGRRDGARHRLIVLIRAADLNSATARATVITLEHGFQSLTIENNSQLGTRAAIGAAKAKQDHLKAAIQKAEETGQAIIVYDDEMPSRD